MHLVLETVITALSTLQSRLQRELTERHHIRADGGVESVKDNTFIVLLENALPLGHIFRTTP